MPDSLRSCVGELGGLRVYLPTFGCFLGQMLVNIPYMEHMGYDVHIA